MNKVNTNEEDIVREYQGLVYKIARRFKSPYLEFDDLVQVGFMGLLKSYHRFDKNKNTKFSTFAVYYIMGAIKDELKKVTKEYALKANQKTIFKENFDDIPGQYLNLLIYNFTPVEEQIVRLRLVKKLSQTEIGSVLAISQSSVSRHLNNIKEKIAELKK